MSRDFVSLVLLIALCIVVAQAQTQGWSLNNETRVIIHRFQQYLQIKTVQPTPDYQTAVSFIKKFAEEVIGLLVKVIEPVAGKPIVIIEWKQKNAAEKNQEKSILLSSHMDVVPVDDSKWKYEPFEAHYELETGHIFGRGAQDMKCVGMQYLEAIHVLKNKKHIEPKRPVYVVFVPDEEIGGKDGIAQLVKSKEFEEKKNKL